MIFVYLTLNSVLFLFRSADDKQRFFLFLIIFVRNTTNRM